VRSIPRNISYKLMTVADIIAIAFIGVPFGFAALFAVSVLARLIYDTWRD